MRYMVLLKSSEEIESGRMPTEAELAQMGAYNDELVKAGVLLAGEGLHPSSAGARVTFEGGRASVTDGPFAETKELLAGFWILQVRSLEEALEWVKRVPGQDGSTIEVRRVFEAEDFGDVFTPELRAQEERHREQEERQRARLAGGQG